MLSSRAKTKLQGFCCRPDHCFSKGATNEVSVPDTLFDISTKKMVKTRERCTLTRLIDDCWKCLTPAWRRDISLFYYHLSKTIWCAAFILDVTEVLNYGPHIRLRICQKNPKQLWRTLTRSVFESRDTEKQIFCCSTERHCQILCDCVSSQIRTLTSF